MHRVGRHHLLSLNLIRITPNNSDLTELSDDVTAITTDLTPTFEQISNVSNYVAIRNVWRWGKWRRIEFHLKDVAYTIAGQPYQIDTLPVQDRPTSVAGVNNDVITYSGYVFRVSIYPGGAVWLTPSAAAPAMNGVIAMIFVVD